jgi:hypothetical protein
MILQMATYVQCQACREPRQQCDETRYVVVVVIVVVVVCIELKRLNWNMFLKRLNWNMFPCYQMINTI